MALLSKNKHNKNLCKKRQGFNSSFGFSLSELCSHQHLSYYYHIVMSEPRKKGQICQNIINFSLIKFFKTCVLEEQGFCTTLDKGIHFLFFKHLFV